jgi:hypothetical protein
MARTPNDTLLENRNSNVHLRLCARTRTEKKANTTESWEEPKGESSDVVNKVRNMGSDSNKNRRTQRATTTASNNNSEQQQQRTTTTAENNNSGEQQQQQRTTTAENNNSREQQE